VNIGFDKKYIIKTKPEQTKKQTRKPKPRKKQEKTQKKAAENAGFFLFFSCVFCFFW
jgi:hypothetical protein